MKKIFKTKKLNVEKIGNIVPQLHIHIIARSTKDSTWPLSVWVVKGKPYLKESLKKIIDLLKKRFLGKGSGWFQSPYATLTYFVCDSF